MKSNFLWAVLALVGTASADPVTPGGGTSSSSAEESAASLVEPSPWTTLLASDEVTMKFFGRAQFDFGWASGDEPTYDTSDGAEIRRARLGVQGTVYDALDYKLEYDFAGGDVDFKDAYLGVSMGFADVMAGHFKEPFSLEEQTSSRFVTFIERSLMNSMSPERNLGVMLTKHYEDTADLTWAFGVFRETNDAGQSNTGSDPVEEDTEYAISGRVTAAPIHDEESVLHLGISYSFRQGNDGDFGFSVRPEAHIPSATLDTGDFAGDSATLGGLEVAYDHGPFGVQAEYAMTAVDGGSGNPDFDFMGWYVQGHWWITGEKGAAAYKAKGGKYDRPAILDNVTREDCSAGGLQLALRYSMIDFDATPGGTSTGDATMDNITFGTNWWLNSHARVSLNYIHSQYEDDSVDDSADILVTRLQVDF